MTARLDNSAPSASDDLWRILTGVAREDDGEAARSHLAAGRPIYYGEPGTPPNLVVKEYPDARRELVRFDHLGEHFVGHLCEPADSPLVPTSDRLDFLDSEHDV